LAIAFLAVLASLHFLKPDFDPSWRLISEYEVGRYGWLMTLAFICWGGSVLTLQVALRTSIRTTSGKIGRWCLAMIGVAMIGAGIFRTTASDDPNITAEAVIHLAFAAVVVLTFPLATSLVAGSLARHQDWVPVRRWLLWATVLVWFSLLAFFAWSIVASMIRPTAGSFSPQLLLGWPNRFVAVAYDIWLIVAARYAARLR
jgi:hypothetical membrane protein